MTNSTGPIPPEVFAECVKAPFGKAKEIIRKYDPYWGRGDDEKISWKVRVSGWMGGTAYVTAATKDEADQLADELSGGDIDWDTWGDDFTVTSVEISE